MTNRFALASARLVVATFVAAAVVFAYTHGETGRVAIVTASTPGPVDLLPFLPSGLTLKVNPSYGVAGTHIQLGGSGFAAGEQVAITFDGTPVTTVTASSSGDYSGVPFVIPSSALPSATLHSFTQKGLTSGRQGKAAVVVMAPGLFGARIAAPGMTMTVGAAGFAPNDSVTLRWGASGPILAQGTADASGDIYQFPAFTVPASAPAGTTAIVATGSSKVSSLLVTIPSPTLQLGWTPVAAGALAQAQLLGFQRADTVTLRYGGTTLKQVSADQSGSVLTFYVALPSSARGAGTLTASDAAGLTASVPLNLQAGIAVAPQRAAPSSVLTVTGSGFAANDNVTLSWSQPPGTPAVHVVAGPGGNLRANLTVPTGEAPGLDTLTATGTTTTFTTQLQVDADWAKLGRDPQHTGVVPGEVLLGPANVSGLTPRWQWSSGGVAGAPAVVGGKVYVADFLGHVTALDAVTGTVRWQFSAGSPQYAMTASPTVADGVVFAVVHLGRSDGQVGPAQVYALDAAQGWVRWSARLPDQGWSSPVVANGVVYAGSAGGVYVFDESTGAPLWHTSNPGSGVWSSVTLDAQKKVMFYGVGNDADAITGHDALTGALLWSYRAPPTGPDEDVAAVPAYADGLVFAGSKNGSMYAVDATTGALRWTRFLDLQDPGILSAAAVHGGRVFVGDGAGMAYALDEFTGAVVWKQNLAAPILTSPVIANGVVYIGQFGGIEYALDETTGAVLWQAQTGGQVVAPAAFSDGALYVANETGQVISYTHP